MHTRGSMLARFAAGALVGATALLGACDAPTPLEGERAAAAGGPSMLITAACAGTGGQTHPAQTITTALTWSRANSPHRVMGMIHLEGAGRLAIAPGAVVCFEAGTGITARDGGRLSARGRDTAQIVLTSRDPARGWLGLQFAGSPAGPSYLTNVRIEQLGITGLAIASQDAHLVYVDSAVIRQAGVAARLYAPGSRLVRSRVDTTTNRLEPAVDLANGARFEQSVVRGAAGIGVRVSGPDVLLYGGRIEGSGGTGLEIGQHALKRGSTALRVTGGRSYPVAMPIGTLARLYPTPALQDSLAGNARDTLVLSGGALRAASFTAGPRMPLRLTTWVNVDSAGIFAAQPGARVYFELWAAIVAQNGGRVLSRGSAANPVVLTADDPAAGWSGIWLYSGPVAPTSYITNTRIEHASFYHTALSSAGNHRVIVDSSVIRQSGMGASLFSTNSRLMRTRVDTTLNSELPAVELSANARTESTIIRAPAGTGLRIALPTVLVVSCEIRDGDGDAIVVEHAPFTVRSCNLVNNVGVGVRNVATSGTVSATGLWWGSTGGPNGPGGDGVAGAVAFTPWRTTPVVLPYVP